ncbi:hypothetical protein BD413DRAFT_232966 [Trametes elegans]|nr:hypothetical protein BD413DRAFT_232966 [Trametes elegans]
MLVPSCHPRILASWIVRVTAPCFTRCCLSNSRDCFPYVHPAGDEWPPYGLFQHCYVLLHWSLSFATQTTVSVPKHTCCSQHLARITELDARSTPDCHKRPHFTCGARSWACTFAHFTPRMDSLPSLACIAHRHPADEGEIKPRCVVGSAGRSTKRGWQSTRV